MPPPAAHARKYCDTFCGCRAEKWRPKFSKLFMTLATTQRVYVCWNFA